MGHPSYQWLSLSTGAANSPTHFANAINNILMFAPLLDPTGQPIYESPSVVKQKRDVLKHTVSYFDDILITSTWQSTYSEMLEEHFANLEQTVRRLCFHGA